MQRSCALALFPAGKKVPLFAQQKEGRTVSPAGSRLRDLCRMRRSPVSNLESCSKGQGGTEYLVTMGAVMFVVLLAIGILLFAMGGTKDAK